LHNDFKKYIRLQNTASSCKHKVQYQGLSALGSLWDLKSFLAGTKKMITDLAHFANLAKKAALF